MRFLRAPMPAMGQPQFRSAAGRAALAHGLLGVTALLAAGRAAVLFARDRWAEGTSPPPISIATLDDLARLMAVMTLALFLATAIAWMAWTSRAVENATALGAGEGTIGPRGAIGWWFVPLANLVVPFAVIAGLGRRLAEAERPSRDLLALAWWLAFVGSGTAMVLAAQGGLVKGGEPAPAGWASWSAWAEVAWAGAALLAIAVIRWLRSAEVDAVQRRLTLGRTTITGAVMIRRPASAARATASGLSAGRSAAAKSSSSTPARAAAPGARSSSTPAPGRRTPTLALPGWLVPLLALLGVLLVTVLPRLLSDFDLSSLLGNPSPTPTLAARPTTVAAGRRWLLDHTAVGDGRCAGVSPVPVGALAAIRCEPADAAVAAVVYSTYVAINGADVAYQLHRLRSGIAAGSEGCRAGEPGETEFSAGGVAVGRLLCLLETGPDGPDGADGADGAATPRLVWVDSRFGILGEATGSRATLDSLLRWWEAAADPPRTSGA